MSDFKDLPLLIVGSGSQARYVIEIVQSDGVRPIIGIADIESVDNIGNLVNGVPVKWTVDQLLTGHIKAHVVIAYGDGRKKQKLALDLGASGYTFTSVVSEAAYVSDSAMIGSGCIVNPSAVVMPNAIIGDHAIIHSQCVVEHDNRIGDFANIAPGVSMGGRVTVGEGARVFTGATLIPDISIGAWATVGAGAVVITDVEPGTTVVGNPAREFLS
jgi:acetyltransferase EpsM